MKRLLPWFLLAGLFGAFFYVDQPAAASSTPPSMVFSVPLSACQRPTFTQLLSGKIRNPSTTFGARITCPVQAVHNFANSRPPKLVVSVVDGQSNQSVDFRVRYNVCWKDVPVDGETPEEISSDFQCPQFSSGRTAFLPNAPTQTLSLGNPWMLAPGPKEFDAYVRVVLPASVATKPNELLAIRVTN